MNISTWINLARKHAGMNQEELALKLGVTKGNVSAWERGRHKPRLEQTVKLAAVTGYSLPVELASWNAVPASIGTRRIPLISFEQACVWTGEFDTNNTDNKIEWLMTDLEHSEQAFSLEIYEESMSPEFRPGDRVIIDPAVTPRPGDFVVATTTENQAIFNKYRPRGLNAAGESVFELVPLNDDFATVRSDLQPTRIIGTMVEHRKYRRA
jgi:SOS-response transcriptional repressor LexA